MRSSLLKIGSKTILVIGTVWLLGLGVQAIERFLERFCGRPDVLMKAIERTDHRWDLTCNPNEWICKQGDKADGCWLILEGDVDIYRDDQIIWTRNAGELVGEQAFLMSMPTGTDARRTASMKARNNVNLLCLNNAFIETLTAEERAEWFQTLAVIECNKLEESTRRRSELQSTIIDKVNLIRKFADKESIGVIESVIDGSSDRIRKRNAIIYFSDIEGFSTWAESVDDQSVSKMIKRLMAAQIDEIRASGGLIDKLMGDGLMAFWFVDSESEKKEVPARAINHANKAIEAVSGILAGEGLSDVLDIRVGLHCGPVVYGDFGTSDRISVTLLGKTVNVAARYEQARSDDIDFGRLRISPDFQGMLSKDSTLDGFSLSEPHKVHVKNTHIDLIRCEVKR